MFFESTSKTVVIDYDCFLDPVDEAQQQHNAKVAQLCLEAQQNGYKIVILYNDKALPSDSDQALLTMNYSIVSDAEQTSSMRGSEPLATCLVSHSEYFALTTSLKKPSRNKKDPEPEFNRFENITMVIHAGKPEFYPHMFGFYKIALTVEEAKQYTCFSDILNDRSVEQDSETRNQIIENTGLQLTIAEDWATVVRAFKRQKQTATEAESMMRDLDANPNIRLFILGKDPIFKKTDDTASISLEECALSHYLANLFRQQTKNKDQAAKAKQENAVIEEEISKQEGGEKALNTIRETVGLFLEARF